MIPQSKVQGQDLTPLFCSFIFVCFFEWIGMMVDFCIYGHHKSDTLPILYQYKKTLFSTCTNPPFPAAQVSNHHLYTRTLAKVYDWSLPMNNPAFSNCLQAMVTVCQSLSSCRILKLLLKSELT